MKFKIIHRGEEVNSSFKYALYADGVLVNVYVTLFFAKWKARRMAKRRVDGPSRHTALEFEL